MTNERRNGVRQSCSKPAPVGGRITRACRTFGSTPTRPHRALLALLVGSALALTACGGGQDDRQRSSTASATARATAATPTATPTPESTPTTTSSLRKSKARSASSSRPTRPLYVACDANIEVKAATTTCPLAQNTFYEYWYSRNYKELESFAAYSASADKWLDMTCHGNSRVTCEADDGSVVRFPMSALRGYTTEAADRYAAKMTVSAAPGDADAPTASEPDPAPEVDTGGGEDPYDSTAYDRDCADFAETDFPTPPGDPDGLDADGDGIACES